MSEIEFNIVSALFGVAWGWVGVESLDFWWKKVFAISKPKFFDYFVAGYLGPIQYLSGYVFASGYGYNFYGKIK